MIDQYRVVRLLGRGGMADVYLARDMVLGRKVAIKLLKRDTGMWDADERFMFEARATAQFSHPNIVAVHGVGDFQNRMYLALEYLEGQTLRDRMRDARLSYREALRFGLAICEALREAHRHGILHRDLKPSNVVIGRDGRLRVVDFGLAKRVSKGEATLTLRDSDGPSTIESLSTIDEGAVRGTPAYMAPEQWTGAECSEATDVWSLGMMTYEMASGAHPFHGLSPDTIASRITAREPLPPFDPSLPGEFRDLVTRCLDYDPARRPDVGSVLEALERFLAGRDGERSVKAPFRGLLSYDERHARSFHGRDSEVAIFVDRLRDQPILPIVGPSGSGKSSFVHAGVIPRLKEHGAWSIIGFRPGRKPIERLVRSVDRAESGAASSGGMSARRAAIADHQTTVVERPCDTTPRSRAKDSTAPPPSSRRAPTFESAEQTEWPEAERRDIDTVIAELRESPARLALWLDRVAERTRGSVVLLVDQLEELYSLVPNAADRRLFLDAMCLAADDPRRPVRVIFTLRDDFLGRAAETPLVREVLEHVTVLRSPEPEALHEILTRPVLSAGYAWGDPELVNDMVREIQGEPAALPLLQFAGQMLWERRDRERRTLTRQAFVAVGGVAGSLATHADSVLATLTVEEVRIARDILLRLVSPDQTRIVVPRGQLLEGLPPAAAHVLDRLTETRTVLVRRSRHERQDAEVELVHESLIMTWDRLKRWLEECREEIVFLRELQQAAESWLRRGAHHDQTWRGHELREAVRKSESLSTPLSETAQRFLQEGMRAERRRLRGRRLAVGGTFALLALSATTFWVAWRVASERRAFAETERLASETRRKEAVEQRSEVLREGARADLRKDDMLAARAKLRVAIESQDTPEGRALWWQVRGSELRWSKNLGANINLAAATGDGLSIALGAADGTIYLLDGEGLGHRALRGQTDQITSIAYSRDGSWIAAGTWSGSVDLWQVASRKRTIMTGHRGLVRRTVFSPDGLLLASGGMDRTIRIWDTAHGRLVRALEGLSGKPQQLSFRPDGARLASTDLEGRVQIWEVATGTQVLEVAPCGARTVAEWSRDGRTLIVVGGGQVRFLDAESGREMEKRPTDATVLGVAERSDGVPIGATMAGAQDVRVTNLRTGAPLALIPGGSPQDAVLTANATRLLVVGEDQQVRMWDLRAPSEVTRRVRWQAGPVYAMAIHPDGRLLASAGRGRSVFLSDVETGLPTQDMPGHVRAVNDLAFSPDGRHLASGAWDNTLRLWNLETRSSELTWSNTSWPMAAVRFSPDGTKLVSSAGAGGIRVYDMKTGASRVLPNVHDYMVFGLDFSRDGGLLASAGGRSVQLWDMTTLQPVRSLQGATAPLRAVRFSPDDKLVIAGGDDSAIRMWDRESGRPMTTLGPMAKRVVSFAFHPDGRRLGVTLSGGEVGVWDLEGKRLTTTRGHRADANRIAFAKNGAWMITAGDDSTLRAWETDSGRAAWFAAGLVGNPPQAFTHRGWLQPGAEPRPLERPEEWRKHVEQNARLARELPGGERLCTATHQDSVVAWNIQSDSGSTPVSVPGLREVVAVPGACVSLSENGEARVHLDSGSTRQIASGASAIGWDGQRVLVAIDRTIRLFRATGEPLTTIPADVGITAMAGVEGAIAVGYRDGSIELVSPDGSKPSPGTAFDDAPSVPVESILAGPPGTIAAGFLNGMLVVWDLRSGATLHTSQLHGPVAHLNLSGHQLSAASELGDHVRVDLSVLSRDYCELLQEVWKEVPVVWSEGRVVEQSMPEGHRCRP